MQKNKSSYNSKERKVTPIHNKNIFTIIDDVEDDLPVNDDECNKQKPVMVNKIDNNNVNDNKVNDNKVNDNKVNDNKVNYNKVNGNKVNDNKVIYKLSPNNLPILNKDEEEEWNTFKETRRNRHNKLKSKNKHHDNIINEINDDVVDEKHVEPLDNGDTGKQYPFNNNWYLWTHLNNSTKWTLDSYQKLCVISNIEQFWKVVNCINKLDCDKHSFYIMRENTYPLWEHDSNKNGGACSLRVNKQKSSELIEQLLILIINESFSDNPLDINGLSFNNKPNWSIIKIWNKDCKNDTSGHVPLYMTKRYSTIIRYKNNEPEY